MRIRMRFLDSIRTLTTTPSVHPSTVLYMIAGGFTYSGLFTYS
jgi:hypothetical protein